MFVTIFALLYEHSNGVIHVKIVLKSILYYRQFFLVDKFSIRVISSQFESLLISESHFKSIRVIDSPYKSLQVRVNMI